MKLPFDEVYCLHLAENSDKYNLMMSEYERVDIKDQVKIWWTVKRKISTQIGNSIDTLHSIYYDNIKRANKNVYGAVFNCALEHYTIVKQAYLRGLNTILVLEDDIKFIDNVSAVEKAFTQLPKKWDVLKFCNGFNTRQNSIPKYNGEDDLWNKITTISKSEQSTACYAFNRDAMKFYIDSMDRCFIYADGVFPFFINNNYNYYDTQYLVVYNDLEQQSDIINGEISNEN